MPRLYSNRDRAYDMGGLPTERLARDPACKPVPAHQPRDARVPAAQAISAIFGDYRQLCAAHLDGAPARARAPLPDDPLALSRNLKASAHFMDATLAGVCRLDDADWLGPHTLPVGQADAVVPAASGHTHALVFLMEFGREPAPDEPGHDWIAGTQAARTDLRCAEVAVVLAGYLRALGCSARGHVADDSTVVLERLAQKAGLVQAVDGQLKMPFITSGFRLGAITTNLELACDQPIAAHASLDWPDAAAYMGVGGTRPGFEAAELAARPAHLGRYPMEQITRVDAPTTLVLADQLVRVPKRADMFTRAQAGDLGERARQERARFAVKHPLAFAMTPLIRNLVPLQGSREPLAPTGIGPALNDPQTNTLALKALAYYLGADLVGICQAEPWMYYSHDEHGKPIVPYHRYALVMLLDQGFETMEGASGDDWISGTQSMRAYLRGALLAGTIAAHLRRLGHSSRAHSNAHSEVLHLPTVLMAGLGEMSRIGEMVLNPFLGPRSKSVVMTTDLPLIPDRPIDFDLQAVCEACNKCARECPCNAIPFGPKVMYNGYEIWKPDVEKCGKYRLTNMAGSACGRCMKTCPYNREDLVESDRLLWLSIKTPAARRALIDHDDMLGAGSRNPVKRWWLDLEIVDGIAVAPAATRERDLQPQRADRLATTQKLAFFPPALQPPGDTPMDRAFPIDRAAGLAAYQSAPDPQKLR